MPSASGAASGALSGFGVGSTFGGPIGGAIGAGIGGLIGLFGGGKKKKQPSGGSNGPNLDATQQQLSSRANMLQGRADVQQEEGTTALNTSLGYYSDILGNDPGAALEATKAERGKVIDQYDTARQSIAQFGPKGGGSTSASAQMRVAEANQLSDIGASLKGEAAQATASIGATIAGIGLSQEQIASADLNTVLDSILSQQGLDLTKRGQTMEMWGGIGEAAGNILGPWIRTKLPGGVA